VQARLNTSCTSTSCSFDNVYQPKPISPALKFIAISAWYSTFNNLAPNVSLLPNTDGNYDFNSVNFSQIYTAIAAICDQPWSDVIKPDRFRPCKININYFDYFYFFYLYSALCFNSMYHWTLLEYGYSMTDANLKNFHIVKTIGTDEIGWTLGYMINQTNSLDPENRPPHLLSKGKFGGLLFLCLLCLIATTIIAFITWKVYKRRQNY
jgi:hypothetical protein